jgi:hypothetical protein
MPATINRMRKSRLIPSQMQLHDNECQARHQWPETHAHMCAGVRGFARFQSRAQQGDCVPGMSDAAYRACEILPVSGKRFAKRLITPGAGEGDLYAQVIDCVPHDLQRVRLR